MSLTDKDIDAAALREALAVIGDWEGDLMEFFNLNNSTSRTLEFASCPTRQPRRAELEELRREFTQLKSISSAWLAQSRSSRESADALALRVECWEMCQRQRIQRRLAERENAKLRELLTGHKLNMMKVERLMQRVLAVQRALPRIPTPTPFFEAYRGPCVELSEQLLRLELLRHETEHIFSSGMFAQNVDQRDFKDIQFRDCRPENDRVEILFGMAWVLPFDLDDVAAAMWTETTRVAPREKHVEWKVRRELTLNVWIFELTNFFADKDLYVNDMVIVSQFIATPFAGVDPGVKHGQTATRRLPRGTQKGEDAIVSTVQLRKFDFGEWRGEAFADVWVHTKTLPSKCGPLTQIKWCRRVCIRPPRASSTTPEQRSQWIQSIMSGPMRVREERNLDWSIQTVENALLDTRRRNCSAR